MMPWRRENVNGGVRPSARDNAAPKTVAERATPCHASTSGRANGAGGGLACEG
jgi:hypothetical protein